MTALKIKDCLGMFLFVEWEGGKCRFSPAYCACNQQYSSSAEHNFENNKLVSWLMTSCRNAVLTFTSICLTLVWSWAYNHISTDQSAFKGAFTQQNINLPPTQLLGFIALHVNKLIPQKFRPLSLSSLAILVSCL